MDLIEARKLLGDVVNLEHRVGVGKARFGAASAKVDRAIQHHADAKYAMAKAESHSDAMQDRLKAARERAQTVPAELVVKTAEAIGNDLSVKRRYAAALAAPGDNTAEVNKALAAAKAAGMDITGAQAEQAKGTGGANNSGVK